MNKDTQEEQYINQEEMDKWIKGNRKNHKLSRKLGCEITSGCAMKRRQCFAIFVRNLRRQSPLHRQKDVKSLEPQLCIGIDCKEHEDAINEEAMRDTFRNTQHRV